MRRIYALPTPSCLDRYLNCFIAAPLLAESAQAATVPSRFAESTSKCVTSVRFSPSVGSGRLLSFQAVCWRYSVATRRCACGGSSLRCD